MFEAENVSVRYAQRLVLDGASFRLEPECVTALIGPNGAGKSTLMKALCGDIPLAGGRVLLDGRSVGEMSPLALAARRAVLPQASALSFPFTVHEVVRLGMETGIRVAVEERRARIDMALSRVDLVGFGARTYQELSGGEQQRVHLARVICQIGTPSREEARYLFLDEPTASLDLRHQLMTLKLARDFAASGGGVLAILHDLNLAAGFADRIGVVGKGRLIAFGRPEEVLTDEIMREVFGVGIKIGAMPPAGIPFVLPHAASGGG